MPVGRTVREWIGKTPDTRVPPRVADRVLKAHGDRCYLTGREIRPGDVWQIEHKKALCNGGENRESNLGPALVEPHKIKTKADRREKKKVDRIRKKRFGLLKARRPMPGSKASGWYKPMRGPAMRRAELAP